MVLFIDPAKKFLERERVIGKPYPHNGLAYVVTAVSSMGIPCKVLDVNAYGLSISDIENTIREYRPKIVAMTTMTYSILDAYEVAEITKKISPDIVVIIGGVHPSLMPERTLRECESIDIVIQGEGEEIITSIAKAVSENKLNKKISKIPSILYRGSNGLEKNPLLKFNDILFDKTIFPDWSLYNYEKYYKIYSEKFNKKINLYQINTSRGCAYKCTFCSPIHSRKVRYRTADSIIDEIKLNLSKFDARHFDFADSNATFRRNNFLELCKKMNTESIDKEISWSIDTNINDLNEEMIIAASKAGCEVISLGIESGSDKMLKVMKKNYSVKEAHDIVKLISENGMKVKTSFILGHPFEDELTAMATYNFALDLIEKYNVEYYYNLIDVYPNTELFDMVDNGIGGSNWLPGMRYGWGKYNRTFPMIEVNDLDSSRLMELYETFNASLKVKQKISFYERTKLNDE